MPRCITNFGSRALSSADHVRQEAQEAGALDRLGQFALLLGRDRGDAAWHDLAAFRNIALQQTRILVIDLRCARAREGAGLAPAKERPTRAAATATAALRRECHGLLLLCCRAIVA